METKTARRGRLDQQVVIALIPAVTSPSLYSLSVPATDGLDDENWTIRLTVYQSIRIL